MRGLVRIVGCIAALAGCDVFDDELARRVLGSADAACRTHAECGADPANPVACVQPEGRCVPLRSDDCRDVTGALASDDALVIGGLFALTGPQASTNLPRRLSAALAVEQIDAVGGVPGPGARKRPLVLLSCDTAQDVERAARHLVEALRVPAIVGPNTSQDVIAVSNRLSAAAGTLLLSPTAVAASIADLDDDGLTWVMVPSDEQRAPLMRQQLGELEQQLRRERGDRPIRLSIVYRDDALGVGTRAALAGLTLNGESLLDNQSAGPPTVAIEPYDPSAPDQAALVARQRAFAPDIVVVAGLAEAVTQIIVPLEAGWSGDARPHYVTIDSLRVPELLAAASERDDLRLRVRGTGVLPSARAQPVYEAFRLDFQARHRDVPATLSGMGPSYDATYALALALAATRDRQPRGKALAAGLRKLQGGAPVTLGASKVLAAFHELAAGRAIDAVGSFGPLAWDERGAPLGGRVEMWCIAPGTPPSFASAGLTLELESGQIAGAYRQCGQPPP